MCGIAGFLHREAFLPDSARGTARAMAESLVHRGPDDAGVWVDHDAGVALAHRRLAVIDRSPAGHQPMVSPSGRYIITFNGEIYNHREIRERVMRRHPQAITWRGNSDTEALLTAIEHHGLPETLQETIGMFAFALWDRSERTLYLARDRLGEKPLYFGWQNGVFLFGSELKALAAHPSFRSEVDRGALSLFLRYNYIPAPWSIYCGIRKLAPGSFLKVTAPTAGSDTGCTSEAQRYWSFPKAVSDGQARPFEGHAEEAVDALHDLLADAVRRQAIADVPLGCFLSGGIDSSTIASLMQAQSSKRVRTFTVGFQDRRYSEAVAAKAVADHLGTEHVELQVSHRDALNVIPQLPALYDEPFADASQIPTSLVARMTRGYVTVALSGDGGDELFGGYDRYRAARIWRTLKRVPQPVRRLGRAAIKGIRPEWWDAMLPARIPSVGDRAHKAADVIDSDSIGDLYHRLVSYWKTPGMVVRQATEPPTVLGDPTAWPQALEPESRMMAVDSVTYLPDDILVKVDRAAMAVSLETRAPFLDHRVVEFAWRLPLSMKICNGQGKWALRQILYRYVPRRLVDRPKMGFGVPLGPWLRGPLRDWAETLLDERRLRSDGFFLPAPIRAKWVEHLSGRRHWHYYLWSVLMFQAWLEDSR